MWSLFYDSIFYTLKMSSYTTSQIIWGHSSPYRSHWLKETEIFCNIIKCLLFQTNVILLNYSKLSIQEKNYIQHSERIFSYLYFTEKGSRTKRSSFFRVLDIQTFHEILGCWVAITPIAQHIYVWFTILHWLQELISGQLYIVQSTYPPEMTQSTFKANPILSVLPHMSTERQCRGPLLVHFFPQRSKTPFFQRLSHLKGVLLSLFCPRVHSPFLPCLSCTLKWQAV